MKLPLIDTTTFTRLIILLGKYKILFLNIILHIYWIFDLFMFIIYDILSDAHAYLLFPSLSFSVCLYFPNLPLSEKFLLQFYEVFHEYSTVYV